VAVEGELTSPVGEVVTVLQQYRVDVDAARSAVEDAKRKGRAALAGQAVLAAKLEAALALYEPVMAAAALGKAHRHLRILKDQMLAAMEAEGLEVVHLLGRPYDEVADIAEVDGWLHRPELSTEVVIEELEPAVCLIRPGRVVMGAPVQAPSRPDDEVDHDTSAPE